MKLNFLDMLGYVTSKIGGHSITTWTRRGGEGGSQMSTIVHAREGGGLRNVHVDKIFGKMQFFAASVIGR